MMGESPSAGGRPVGARSRGVRLSDLDRSKVYRIGYTGRRWEVLGPEVAPAAPGAPVPGTDAAGRRASAEAATTPGRHAAAPGEAPPADAPSRSVAGPEPR